MVVSHTHTVPTTGQGDAHDLSAMVSRDVVASGLTSGIVTIFVVGSTAGITTLEFEPGVVHDISRVFESLAPRAGEYRHHLRWGDDNGSSHVRAALLGASVTIPFEDCRLCLGQWQQIALLEFDTQARTRQIVVQIMGD